MRKLKHILFTFASFAIFFIAFILLEIGNWYQQGFPNLNNATLKDITFTDSLNGYGIANLGFGNDNYILKTTNAGDNWNIIKTYNQPFVRIIFINDSTGFTPAFSQIFKTTNKGVSWDSISLPSDVYGEDMSALNKDTIYFVNHEGLTGGVLRTTNGGLNWIRLLSAGSQNPRKIYMFNARIGFVSNGLDNNFKKTTNGGVNWFDVPGGSFSDIKFADSLIGWKVRGNIQKTTDGGLNWETQMLPLVPGAFGYEITKINVLNKDTLWASGASISYPSGYRGVIHKTINGGSNWGYQIPDTSIHVFSYDFIKFTDRLKGWAYSSISSSGGVHTKTGGLDTTIYTDINSNSNEVVSSFKLHQNYPNPFNPATIINYRLSINSFINLKVYDLQGKEVQTLVNKKQSAGSYSVKFNGTNLSSGIYFYTFQSESYKETKKMILVK